MFTGGSRLSQRLRDFWRISWLPVFLTFCCCIPISAQAQLLLLRAPEPQQVFAGQVETIRVTWRNSSAQPVALDIRTRLYQASSSTAVFLGESPWKNLTVLPTQTIQESASFNFPAVTAESRFVIQWLAAKTNILGLTDVLVYPRNVLKELRTLAGAQPVGVFDPLNRLKPLLSAVKVDMTDLETVNLTNFSGHLAFVGPFETKTQMPEALANHIKSLAEKGTGVVWIEPPRDKTDLLKPSFYAVPEGRGGVVVVQDETVAHLADNPQAQLNLLHFARLALRPQPPTLPYLTAQP